MNPATSGSSPRTAPIVPWLVLTLVVSLAFFLVTIVRNPVGNQHLERNPAYQEALGLTKGTISIPSFGHDAALTDSGHRNVFQPGQTLFFLGHWLITGARRFAIDLRIDFLFVHLATAAASWLAMYWLLGKQAALASALTVSLVCGTPFIASIGWSHSGAVWRINNCFSVLFQALFVLSLARPGPLSTRKLALAGLSLALAMIFRLQSVLFALLPVLLLAREWWGSFEAPRTLPAAAAAARAFPRRLGVFFFGPLVAACVIGGFNYARFGDPLETGYTKIYGKRDTEISRRFQERGLNSIHFLPENLYRTLLANPEIEFDGFPPTDLGLDPRGNSLLFSQPILILFLVFWRGARRFEFLAYALAAVLAALPVLTYHNPGFHAPGYVKYSLDYLVLVFAALAVEIAADPERRMAKWFAFPLVVWACAFGLVTIPP